jgi:hypothetical protein
VKKEICEANGRVNHSFPKSNRGFYAGGHLPGSGFYILGYNSEKERDTLRVGKDKEIGDAEKR